MYFQELFAEALQEPFTAIAYHVSRHLAASYPDRAMIEGCDSDFNKLFDFAKAGRCLLRRDESTHNQVAVWWSSEQGIVEYPRNAWFEVEWEGHALDVVVMDWGYGCIALSLDHGRVARRRPAVLRGGLRATRPRSWTS